jgi:hypothetical protein
LTNTGTNNAGWLFTGDEINATTYIKNNSFAQLLAGSAVTICRCETVTISDRTEATLAAPLDTAERALQAIKRCNRRLCIVWMVVKSTFGRNQTCQ